MENHRKQWKNRKIDPMHNLKHANFNVKNRLYRRTYSPIEERFLYIQDVLHEHQELIKKQQQKIDAQQEQINLQQKQIAKLQDFMNDFNDL